MNTNLKTLLIAEDEPELLALLKDGLAEDYHLHLVSDGRGVLNSLAQRIPDVLVMDILMPGLNAYQVLEELACQPDLKPPAIILASGLPDTPGIVNKLKTTFDIQGFITKPYRLPDLKNIINQTVEEQHGRQAS